MRDNHLRSAELFDVENRTSMSYRSTRVRGEGSAWILDGELTIGTITQPLALAVEFGGVQPYYDGSRHAGFEATGEIRRKDFDLDFGPIGAMLGDTVKIELARSVHRADQLTQILRDLDLMVATRRTTGLKTAIRSRSPGRWRPSNDLSWASNPVLRCP